MCLHFIPLPRVCAWLSSNITTIHAACQVPVFAFGCPAAGVDRLRLGVDQRSTWRHFIWWKGSSTNRDKTSLITPPQRQAAKRRQADQGGEGRKRRQGQNRLLPQHGQTAKRRQADQGGEGRKRRQGQNRLLPQHGQTAKRRQADQGGERHEGEQAPLAPQTEGDRDANRAAQPASRAEAPNSARAPRRRRAGAEHDDRHAQADGQRGRSPGTGTGAAEAGRRRGRRAEPSRARAAGPREQHRARRRGQGAHKRDRAGDEGGRHGRPGDAEHAQARNRGGGGDGGPISASSAAGPHGRGRRQGAHNRGDGGAHRRRRRTGTREANNRRH